MAFVRLAATVAVAAALAGWSAPPAHSAQGPVAAPPDPAVVARAVAPIAWVATFDAARQAARPGQVIVVDVSTEWCSWCHYMETKVYPDPAVRDFAAGNLFVRINPKDGATGELFAKRQKVKAYPTFFVFAPDGRLIRKQVGAFEGPADFLDWLRAAARR